VTDQPTLTDGVVTIRPWRDEDVDEAVAGHDELLSHWFGFTGPPSPEGHREAIRAWRRDWREGSRAGFVITVDDRLVGSVDARLIDPHTAELSWTLYAGQRGQGYATRAVRVLVDWALSDREQGGLGVSRVEAKVEPGNVESTRVATRAGLRREGVRRVAPGAGDRAETTEYVVLARLRDDPPLSDPQSFRALLNSFLPRKRAISQMLIRDPDDRVLLCQLTYKRDWDLPGGVVEVGESPQLAVAREVEEELGLQIQPHALLLTDWLPPWGGWDDALCLVWDGGVHDPAITDRIVEQTREIRRAAWATPADVRERCADFTARRIEVALANQSAPNEGGAYSESGVLG
jgi:RimJ/RimL family protein N-acetyltransferase/8-oxo-dGTP pyrophosphatase MutT (NUDIX family)